MTDRAREMVARLGREWHDARIATEDHAALVRRATNVMADRATRFIDDHHPAFLHPLRTVLLLLEIGETDPRAHAAALELDSERESRADGAGPDRDDTPASTLLWASDDERLELLLLTEPWVRRTWLAERLDHVRHLHLWAGDGRTRAALARAAVEEAPLALREGGRLHRAWADWMDKADRHRLAERAEVRVIGPSRPGSTSS